MLVAQASFTIPHIYYFLLLNFDFSSLRQNIQCRSQIQVVLFCRRCNFQ